MVCRVRIDETLFTKIESIGKRLQGMNTISDSYLALQKELHRNQDSYGSASVGYAPLVLDILEITGFKSISDYGAGKCRLGNILKDKAKSIEYFPFDPAFPEYGEPKTAELVTCIDVLEHIEPEYLNDVVEQLSKLIEKVGLLTVHTGPAQKTLADGRNAHLIQQPASWWLEHFLPYFDIIQLMPVSQGFWVIVQRKGGKYSPLFVSKPNYATLMGRVKRRSKKMFNRFRNQG